MTFTSRFSVLALWMAFVGLSAVFEPLLLTLSLLGALGLSVLTAIDWWQVPPQSSLRVVRSHAHKLIVGKPHQVILEVENVSQSDLMVTLHDEPPDVFQIRDATFTLNVQAGGTARVEYVVHPPIRGDYEFMKLTAVVTGPFFGFVRRHYLYPAHASVSVYPDFKQADRMDMLTMHRRLSERGVRSSREFGLGTEFEGLREYTPDDDYRRICWNATARSARPISMQFQAEKSQQIVSMIDAGRLMGTEAYGLTRLDYAIDAMLMLSHVACRKGDKAGALVFSDGIDRFVRPGRGSTHLGLLMDSTYGTQNKFVESDYSAAFDYLQTHHKRRSLIVVFTDIVDENASDSLIRNMVVAAKRHLILCVLMRDRWIHDVMQEGISGRREAFRIAVTAELAEARQRAIGKLTSKGIHVVDVLAKDFIIEVVNQYIAIKNRALL